jgi:hypothetical protein
MTKRLRKKFWRLERGYGERPAVGSGEVGSAIGQKPAADEQSYLGPYPVAKLLPTFDNLTFRKLRSTVQADRHPMVWIGLS